MIRDIIFNHSLLFTILIHRHGKAVSLGKTGMAKVVDIKTKEWRDNVEEYMDLLVSTESLIQQLRKLRQNQHALDEAVKLLAEFRFNGRFSANFRKQTYRFLEELMFNMYEEVNDGG